MPYIDSEEFCLGKEYHIVPLVLKKPQRNNKPPPPQPHHQTKIKKATKIQSIWKNSWSANWAHPSLALSISYRHLGQETARHAIMCRQVLQKRKDVHVVQGRGKERWPPVHLVSVPICSKPGFWAFSCNSPTRGTVIMDGYISWKYLIYLIDTNCRRNWIKFTLNSNFVFLLTKISGEIWCQSVAGCDLMREDQSSMKQQEQWRNRGRAQFSICLC